MKYGAADHRVLQARKQGEANILLRQEIHVAHTQPATPVPTVDENSYVFHGFVRNGDRQPLPRLTVALYDEKGQWLRELGYGCTDEKGYFILRFAREAPRTPEEQKKAEAEAAKLAAEKAAEEGRVSGGEKPAEAAPPAPNAKSNETGAMNRLQPGVRDNNAAGGRGRTAEIRVYDAKQTLLHREAKPLTPKLGNIDYREITIDSGEPCAPPPGTTEDPPPPAPAKPAEALIPAPTAPTPAPAAVARPPAAVRPEKSDAPERAGTRLENIKGVGPETAAKLSATGIKDIEALKETETERLIEIAGTDKKAADFRRKTRSSRTSAAKKKKK